MTAPAMTLDEFLAYLREMPGDASVDARRSARRILRCVTTHDKLVAALSRAQDLLLGLRIEFPGNEAMREISDEIRSVLAEAREPGDCRGVHGDPWGAWHYDADGYVTAGCQPNADVPK